MVVDDTNVLVLDGECLGEVTEDKNGRRIFSIKSTWMEKDNLAAMEVECELSPRIELAPGEKRKIASGARMRVAGRLCSREQVMSDGLEHTEHFCVVEHFEFK